MPEPTTPPAPATPAPAPAAPTPAPGEPAPGATPPDDDQFVSDRQRRRFAELSGRVGLRERERDEARSRVEQLLTREVERVAAGSLAVPTDVWLEGATVADLLSEDGSDIDPAKVKATVDALVAKRPGLRVPAQVRPLPGGHAMAPADKPPTFAETIAEKVRGRL